MQWLNTLSLTESGLAKGCETSSFNVSFTSSPGLPSAPIRVPPDDWTLEFAPDGHALEYLWVVSSPSGPRLPRD